ncbi:glycosyltransferase family 4 protein [Candidatus Nomurabacteria bacterium]|nr:glycosyltransferase family 4 protein [Candidatus Nomurabacteria bacterium]
MAKKLKIYLDAEVLVVPHFSGIGHYTLELLRALDDIIEDRNDIQITLGVYFRNIGKIKSYGFRNFRFRKTPFPMRISNGLKIRGLQPYYDLFFGRYIYIFPNYTSWPLLFSKSISMIYDLSFEYHSEYVEPRNQKFLSDNVKKTVKNSTRIVTISENSKKEILDFYNLDPSKIKIVYPGVDQSSFFRWPKNEIAKVKARYGIHGKYILFVGNIEPRKNLKNLLLAYEKLPKSTRKEYSLLLVGARGWLDDEIFKIIERLRIAGNFIQQPLGWVEDKDRAALYSGASLFVYPSKYEGFGIPPVEAMACGVPVVTSDNSSLPEAAGKAAKYVNADSIDQLQTTIQHILSEEGNQAKRQTMVEEGYKQVDKFSWQEQAEKLLELTLEVANE